MPRNGLGCSDPTRGRMAIAPIHNPLISIGFHKLGSIAPMHSKAIVYFAIKSLMRIKAKIFKSLLVAWLCLVSMVEMRSLPRFVLCFGEDGHIELEISVNDRCGPETADAGTAAFASQDADHCGECSDVPLFSQTMQGHFAREAAAPQPDFLPLGIPFSAPAFRYVPAPASAGRAPAPANAPASLASLRTVRILV